MKEPGLDIYTGDGCNDTNLIVQYKNTHNNGPVAYVDESYQAPSENAKTEPFYLLTAVLVERKDILSLRHELLLRAGTNDWHSAKKMSLNEHKKIDPENFERNYEEAYNRMESLTHLASKKTYSIISLKRPIEQNAKNAEDARKNCFVELYKNLFASSSFKSNGLIIFDQRNKEGTKIDEAVFHDARTTHQTLPIEARVLGGKANKERLLWLPDIVSWSVSQQYRNPYSSKPEFWDIVSSHENFAIFEA